MERIELRKVFLDKIVPFPLDEYGVTVYLRPLMGSDRAKSQALFARAEREKDAENNLEILTKSLVSFVISRALVDENGVRLYSDEDAEKIGDEMPGAAMDDIFSKILAISKLKKDDVEHEVKNSTPTPSAASSSGSQQGSDGGMSTDSLPD